MGEICGDELQTFLRINMAVNATLKPQSNKFSN